MEGEGSSESSSLVHRHLPGPAYHQQHLQSQAWLVVPGDKTLRCYFLSWNLCQCPSKNLWFLQGHHPADSGTFLENTGEQQLHLWVFPGPLNAAICLCLVLWPPDRPVFPTASHSNKQRFLGVKTLVHSLRVTIWERVQDLNPGLSDYKACAAF